MRKSKQRSFENKKVGMKAVINLLTTQYFIGDRPLNCTLFSLF